MVVKGIRICHVNTRSLYSKINQLSILFQDSDLLCCTETWLDNRFTNKGRRQNTPAAALTCSSLPGPISVRGPDPLIMSWPFRGEKIYHDNYYLIGQQMAN